MSKDIIYREDVICEIEYELEMIDSALDSITLDFNSREKLRQRRGEAREILNSIQQLPSAQPETCEGCKHLGKWEPEVEYGCSSPCTCCKRIVNDNYER